MRSLKFRHHSLQIQHWRIQSSKASQWLFTAFNAAVSRVFCLCCFCLICSFQLNASQAPTKILWLSDGSTRAAQIQKGFNHYFKQKKKAVPHLEIQNPKSKEALEALLTKDSYDFIVSGNSSHWFLLKTIQTKAKKLGLMLSAKELLKTQKKYQHDPLVFAISEQQPSFRFFALINALELFNSQTASLFLPEDKEQRLDYENKAKHFKIPFQAIVLDNDKKTIHAINALKDCCKTLLLKKEDLDGSIPKRKSLLIHSYKNKVMVIGDQPELLKKGAMLVLYSQPYKIGLQAAKTVDKISYNLETPKFQEPEEFMINSNRNINRTLGFSQLSLGRLINAIKAREKHYNAELDK